MTYEGIDAGRQTPAHQQLSRALWLRKHGDVFRFLLDPASEPALTLERIDQGAGTIPTRVSEARAQGRTVDNGLVLVDEADGLIFCTTVDAKDFLHRLSAWAHQAIAAVPAVGLLIDAGAGPLTVDPTDDVAARAYLPDGEKVVYDTTLWDNLLVPDVATLATALAVARPGERMWFWLAADETEAAGGVPLILQPIAWDPNHDRTDWLVNMNTNRGAGEGSSGTAKICDNGKIQFLGVGLHRAMLEHLAGWVARHHADYPALARLVDCQLVASAAGRVDEIMADATMWSGVTADLVPETIGATAAALESLPVGAQCWFWITGSPTDPPFLHLVPTGEDPEGNAFQATLPRLYQRFAESYQDAIVGVMSRPTANRLLFSSQDKNLQRILIQVQALLDCYSSEFPSLLGLAGATVVQAAEGEQPRVVGTIPV